MEWHIARAQPGKDRIAEDALRNERYLVYRPIIPALVRHGRGRLRNVIKSMFPTYLFVIDDRKQGWHYLRNAHGIRIGDGLMTINGRLATVDDAIVDEVKREEQRQCTTPLQGEKIVLPYKVGDTVRIEEGPFCGLFGEVARLDDIERVCLLMTVLGRESRVHLSHRYLAASA